MYIKNSIEEGYLSTRKHWLSQGMFAIIYSVAVGLLVLPFAFFVAITSTIIDEGGESEFSGQSILFWFSIILLVFTGIMFVSMFMGTLQFRALEKEKGQRFVFEDALKHPFIEGRFRSYLYFSGYFLGLNVVIGFFFWAFQELLGLNESHDYGVLDMFANTLGLIIFIVMISAANISVLAIARGEASLDAFAFGWKKYYASFVDLFAINFVANVVLAVPIAIIALIGIIIGNVGPDDENVDQTAGELAITLFLTLIIIIVSLFHLFFAFPLYAAIVARGNENTDSETVKGIE